MPDTHALEAGQACTYRQTCTYIFALLLIFWYESPFQNRKPPLRMNNPAHNRIPPRRKTEQVDGWSSMIANSLDLKPDQVVELHDLAKAHVEVLGARHFVQTGITCLIGEGRVLPHSMIYLPLRGRIEWRGGENTWPVRPGQIILCAADQPHGAVSLDKEFEVVSVHAHIQLPGAPPDRPLFKKTVHNLNASGDYWMRKLDAVATLAPDPGFSILCGNIVRMLLIDLALNGAKMPIQSRVSDPRVELAMEVIENNLADPEVLQKVLDATGLSPSRLRYLFSRELNLSPKAYHQTVRLREVKRLLSLRAITIKEVAARVGYANQQHLEKDFKKSFGVPPGSFRKTL